MPSIARLGALLIAILALTLVAACGADDEDATATPSGNAGQPTSTEALTPAATAGDEQPEIDGTAWLLEGMNGVEMDLQIPITLSFDDGQLAGYAGCNDYGGTYSAGPDGAISISELHQTDMDCETGMDLEAEYLSTLQEAAHYTVIENARLELAGSDGETLIVFTIDDRLPLDDTTWSVTELDGKPVISGTDIHFYLRAGEISGSGGCNTFGGQYDADEMGAFSVSELFWTEMGCVEPEGAMEQEQAFFEALAEASAYESAPDKSGLALINARGEMRIIAADRDEASGADPLDDTAWVLATLHGQDVADDLPVTIHVAAGQFAGTAGCRSYIGTMETAPGDMITYLFGSFYAPDCGDPAEQQPDADEYLAALHDAAQYRTTPETLEFLNDDGTVVLAFRPALTGTELEDTAWSLVSLSGASVIPDTEITFEFLNGYVTGTGGCNGYGSPYIVSEPGVVSIPSPTRTDMACEEPAGVQEQEEAFFAVFPRVRAYQFNETSLELLSSQGDVILTFAPTTPHHRRELVDTAWKLTQLNGDDLIPGTEITLEISEEMMIGNGGCNGYGVQSYVQPGPGVIELGEIVFEAKACTEPAGIMEQETAYRDVLRAVAGYQVAEIHLLLLDSRGNVVLEFERQR